MAVAVPNSRALLSHAEIEQILRAYTQTPEEILGEPLLPPTLPPRRPRVALPSDEEVLAITSSYVHPLTLLGEPLLPPDLPPRRPRKRPLAAELHPPDHGSLKKRKKQSSHPPASAARSKSAAAAAKPKKGAGRKPKVDATVHKSLKLTVRLPTNAEPSVRPSVSPSEQLAPAKPKSEKKSSKKERSKESRREKEKLRLRSSPTPPPDANDTKGAKIRSSPAPPSDSKQLKKGNDRLSFRSSPAPLIDLKETRRDVDRPKSNTSPAPVPEQSDVRFDTERPVFRSSPLQPLDGKDSRSNSERSRRNTPPAEVSEAKDNDRRRIKSSPAKHTDAKETKRDIEKSKSQRSKARVSETKSASSKSAKKPPASAPLPRPAARIPRSEPALLRSSSPEGARKSNSSKLATASRTFVAKERRAEKNMARRRESSVERGRRDEKDLPRKRRESSADSVPPRSKLRDAMKRKHRTRDDDVSDDEQVVSCVAERERGSEKEYDRSSDRDVLRGKNKEKQRKAPRDKRRSDERDSDFERSRRRDERVHERDGYREKEKHREKDSEREHEKNRDSDWDRERIRSKVPEKTRDRGLKRDLDRNGDMEKERERKTMRKEYAQDSDTAQRRSKEREDVPVSKPHHANPKGSSLGFRSEPADKVMLKSNRDTKSDASGSEKERDRTKESTPRKSLPRFRSRPANAIKDAGAAESKSTEVSRNVKEAASPASTHADPLPRPTNHRPTKEELRVSGKQLEQLGADQRELLSQFDSLSKLCDDFLSKEKHDDFEETAKNAFNVFFKFCLKKETEMRLRKRTHRDWMETRKEVLTKYKYLARQFGTQRISELEKLGRARTARFLSHQVHKIYVRMFILQRCWNKELRSGEGEMKSVMNRMVREGSAADKNKLLTPRRTSVIANLLNDYANIVCLFDAIVSDWTDGDDEAGFEMTMPF